MAREPLSRLIYMPVFISMARVSSSLPEGMRSRKAAINACISPHSVAVSFRSPQKAGLNSRSLLAYPMVLLFCSILLWDVWR